MSEIMSLDYGSEEGIFHMQHVKRTEPFERIKHHHGTYEIYYLLSGQRAFFIKDRSYLIAAGDLLLINKYELHKTSVVGQPEHERIVINFSDALIDQNDALFSPFLFTAFSHPSGVFRLKLQEQQFVQTILHKLTRELHDKASGYEIYIKLLMVELLLFAGRCAEMQDPSSLENTNPQHRKISEIVRYINQYYSEAISLEYLSKQFYISPFYISRAFKEVTGFTFIEFLNKTRIREAQRLLHETDFKIIDIAGAVGIDNVSHFGRTFKQMTGTTPVKYRKMKP
jgi:AraC-like DNA-binding protein